MTIRPMRTPALLAVAGLLAVATGCSAPRVIRTMTGSGDQVKLIYERQALFNSETGLIQCQQADDGSLTQCREVPITFYKEGEAQ